MISSFFGKSILLNKKKYFIAKALLILFGLILIFLFILPFLLFKVLNIGNMLGLSIGVFFLCIGIFLSKIIATIKIVLKKKPCKIFLICILHILIVGFTLFIYAHCLMISKIATENHQTNTVIVLGCQVIGESPSIMLNERIDVCYNYLTNNPDSIAILSGGQGGDEGISEAECMYRALVKKGIPEDRLLKENKSTSTKENLEFSKDIILEKQLSSQVVIITNDFH